MSYSETAEIFTVASKLFANKVTFTNDVVEEVGRLSEGYPYFAQLIGKSCVNEANARSKNHIDPEILSIVTDKIRSGQAFPNLEATYQRAIGESEDRAMLLTLLAEQQDNRAEYDAQLGQVFLSKTRPSAQELGVAYMDQLLPRLIEERYGPILAKIPDTRGSYEFTDPVFRAYVKLRRIGRN
jgi:hypothetical protein